MGRIKISKNFFLDEYVPEHLYRRHEKKPHRLLALIDQRLPAADQILRDRFGPTTINNWWHGGDRNWSGIRTIGSPYYSETSQHPYGRASDKIFKEAPAEEVRNFIEGNWQYLGITAIEKGVSWVHSDVRWLMYNKDKLLIFKK